MTTTTAEPAVVPSHVPAQLRWDHNIDVFPAQFADPYVGTSEALHKGPDVVWATRGAYCGRPGWMLTRYALIQEVHLDPGLFSSQLNGDATALLGFDLPLAPFETDPPDHRVLRGVLAPFFTPAAMAALEGQVQSTCDELIAKFQACGGCEFVSEVSSLLPSYIFLALMGLPRDLLPRFMEWEHGFMRGETLEIRRAAMISMYEYFKDLIEERRRAPQDDITTAIATAELEDRELTEAERGGMCVNLFIGGLDSVTSGLGWYMRHLATHPDLQARLRDDPSLIPAAVEELSRAYGTNCTKRTVTRDVEFHGAPMRKGDLVALPTFLASRDMAEYGDPHRIDLDRRPRSMTFGYGTHHCLGIHLAKREARIVIAEFLSRFRDIRIPAGEAAVWTTQTLWSVKKLPLAWR
jgi:cytochrome P450